MLREYSTALSALVRGERVTTHGQYVRLDDVALDFPPLIVPPLLIGGIRSRTVWLAGELADGLILPGGVPPSDVRIAASCPAAWQQRWQQLRRSGPGPGRPFFQA